MFESILERVLNNTLGEFLEGLDRNKLSVSIWSGDINIHQLKFKPDCLIALGLPFDIVDSIVGDLKVKVPWKAINS